MVPVSARLATKPARLSSTPRALLLAALLFAAWPSMVEAQYFPENSIPDTFNDQSTSGVVLLGRPDGLLGPYADTGYFGPYLSLQHTAGDGPGYRDNGYTTLGLFAPKKAFSGILFGEGRLSVDDFGELIGNVGGGYRYYSAAQNRIYGASAWYDVDAGHNSTFTQGGVSLETRGQHWDFFLNGYYPIDDDPKQFRRIATPTGNTTFGFSGVNLAFNNPNLITRQSEVAMTGFDAELGGPLPIVGKYGIRGYGGYYHYENDNVSDVNGGRMRLQADLTDSLSGQFMLTNDNQFDTSAIFNIAWTLPGSGASRGEWNRPGVNRSGRTVVRAQSPSRDSIRQYYRMFQPTQRNQRLFVTRFNTRSLEDNFVLLTDPNTGQPIVVFHMDSRAAAGGDGTFETPFANPQEAQAGTGNGAIIYTHAGSVFDNPANNFIALQPNQQLLGEGPTYLINTGELGAIPIPASGDGGGFPLIQGAGGPAAITLANGSRVSAFDINDSTMAGILADAGLTAGNSALVERTTINGGPIGLDVMNAAGTVNFADTSAINNTTVAGLNVAGAATTGTVNVDGTITNTAGRSFFIDNLQDGGSVNINGQVTATGGIGSVVQNSAGNVNTVNLSLMNIDAGSTGLSLIDNPDAAISLGTVNIMTNDGPAFVARNSGTLSNATGNLIANGGPAIFLDNTTLATPFMVNLRFNDVTSNNSAAMSSSGIHVEGVSGLLAINGTTDINTPMGRGLEIIDAGADVTLATLNITGANAAGGALGNAIFLQDNSGGAADLLIGTLTVNSGLIEQTADGSDTFLIDGGSSNVDIAADINHGVGVVNDDAMVSITNTNIGTANFTGTLVANDGTGVQIDDADGNASFLGTTTLDGDDAGVDILGSSDGTFIFNSNTSIVNPTGVAFNVDAMGTNTNPRIIYSGTIENDADRVISITDTAFGADMITFDSTAADAITDTGTGILLDNVGQTVSFLADTELTGTDGIEISGGSGLFTFADTDIDVMGTAFEINGGGGTSTARVNLQNGSTITQSSNNSTVTIAEHSAGTVQFNGAIDATDGNGLQFNDADGTYNFNNAVTLNGTMVVGADTGIDILNDSAGTFNFPFTNITDPVGTAFNVEESSATITYGVGAFGFFGTITKTNAGLAVNFEDNTGGSAVFNGPITAEDAAAGINIVHEAAGPGVMDATYTFNGPVVLGTMADPLTGGTAVNIDNNMSDTATTFDSLEIVTDEADGLVAGNGGTLTINGGNIETTEGLGIALDTIEADVTLTDVTVDGAGGPLVDALGFNMVTGMVQIDGDVTVTDGVTGFDQGINITGGDATYDISSGMMDAINISDSTNDGIFIMGNMGTITTGDAEITDAGTNGLTIDGADAALTFGAYQITDAGGNGIDISNTTAAGTATFGQTNVTLPGGNGINLTDNAGAFVTNGGTIMVGAAGTGIMADYDAALLGPVRGDITILNVVINGGAATGAGIDIAASGAETTPFQVLIDDVIIGAGPNPMPVDGIVLTNIGAGRMDVTLTDNIVSAGTNGLNATTAAGSTLQLNIGTTVTAGQTNTGLGNDFSSYLFTNDGDMNLGVSDTITADDGSDIPDADLNDELNVFGNLSGGAAIMDPDVTRAGLNELDAVNPDTIPLPVP